MYNNNFLMKQIAQITKVMCWHGVLVIFELKLSHLNNQQNKNNHRKLEQQDRSTKRNSD